MKRLEPILVFITVMAMPLIMLCIMQIVCGYPIGVNHQQAATEYVEETESEEWQI